MDFLFKKEIYFYFWTKIYYNLNIFYCKGKHYEILFFCFIDA